MKIIGNKFIVFLLILIIAFSISVPVFADEIPPVLTYNSSEETNETPDILQKLKTKVLTRDFFKKLLNELKKVFEKLFDFLKDLLDDDEETVTEEAVIEETYKKVEYFELAQMDVVNTTGNRYLIAKEGEKIKLSYALYSIEGWTSEKEKELTNEELNAISKKIDDLNILKEETAQEETQNGKITYSYLIKFESETTMHEDVFYYEPTWKEDLVKTLEEYLNK